MYPHVQNMVDEQCELPKQKMKEKPAAELGSFQNAVTTADGAWLTRVITVKILPIRLEIT